jgi:hypothetical protein
MKVFILISAGTRPANVTNGIQPYLNIERYNEIDGKYEFGCTEKFLKAYLSGLAWIPKEEYLPFIENAVVGDMTLLKDMIAVVRLKDFDIMGRNHE